MRLFKYFCLLAIIGLTHSCKKEIPFPDEAADSFLVVNCLFSPSNPFQVYVGKSYSINDTILDDNFVNNAQVILKDEQGNTLSELQHNGNGLYSNSMSTVSHAISYQLEVIQSGQTNATSKSYVPKEFTCNHLGQGEQYINDRLVWAFELEIVDHPDEENYYLIEGYFDIENGEHNEYTINETNGYIEPHTSHFTNDPNAENSSIVSGTDFEVFPLRSVFLTDKNFNGETYQTTVGLLDYDIHDNDFDGITAIIFVKSVSKEMYQYHKSLELYRLSQGNIFAQPEVIFSNIENGLGIFGGYTQQAFTIDLPKSEYTSPSNVYVENEGCTSPCVVSFSTDGGSQLNYNWDFGDGNTSNEPNPEHSYSSPGEYHVELIISTSPGSFDSYTLTVVIN